MKTPGPITLLQVRTASFERCAFHDLQSGGVLTIYTGRMRVAQCSFTNITELWDDDPGAYVSGLKSSRIYTDLDRNRPADQLQVSGELLPLAAGADVAWLTAASPALVQLRQVRRCLLHFRFRPEH